MKLNQPWNDARLARVRAEQADPMVQYIVVPRSTQCSLAQLAIDTARAVQACEGFSHEPEWRAWYQLWLEQSFRKICLRAKPGQWDRLLATHELARRGDVAVLPPRPRSKRSELLGKLQVLSSLHSDDQLPRWQGKPLPGLNLLVNESLGMSAGKLLAQIGHASLRPGNTREPVHVFGVHRNFDQVSNQHDVWVVQDAGFTEVEAGSETVYAIEC